MNRTFKLALFVSLAAHAMVFAMVRVLTGGGSQPMREESPRIVMLVPVTEDTGRVKYRRSAEPDYPALATRRRQEGTVLLDVIIAPDGKPKSVSIKHSSSFALLDKAAVEAVQHWEFDVETSVPVRAEIPVRFELLK